MLQVPVVFVVTKAKLHHALGVIAKGATVRVAVARHMVTVDVVGWAGHKAHPTSTPPVLPTNHVHSTVEVTGTARIESGFARNASLALHIQMK